MCMFVCVQVYVHMCGVCVKARGQSRYLPLLPCASFSVAMTKETGESTWRDNRDIEREVTVAET